MTKVAGSDHNAWYLVVDIVLLASDEIVTGGLNN